MSSDPWAKPDRRAYRNGLGAIAREHQVHVRQWVATEALFDLARICRAFAARIAGEK